MKKWMSLFVFLGVIASLPSTAQRLAMGSPSSAHEKGREGLHQVAGASRGEKGIDARLFPNPSSGRIVISGLADGVNIDVFTVQGVLVWKGQGTEVDLSELPKGIYIVRAGSKSEGLWTWKVVLSL